MDNETIVKSLIVQEDIEFGEGIITQTRNGNDYSVNKVRTIYPINNFNDLSTLDGIKYPKVALFEDNLIKFYQYNGASYSLVSNSSGGGSEPNEVVATPQNFTEAYTNDDGNTLFLLDNTNAGYFYTGVDVLTKSLKLKKSETAPYSIQLYSDIYIESNIPEIYLDTIGFSSESTFGSSSDSVKYLKITVLDSTIQKTNNYTQVETEKFNLTSMPNATFQRVNFLDIAFIGDGTGVFFDACRLSPGTNMPPSAVVGSTVTTYDAVSSDKNYIYNGSWVLVNDFSLSIQNFNVSANTYQILFGLIAKARETKEVTNVEAGYLNVDNYSKIMLNSTIPLAISRIENDNYITELTIYTKQDNVIITSNEQIVLKDNLNKTLNTGQLIRLTKIDNKWLEV